jgi:hypothetical protein
MTVASWSRTSKVCLLPRRRAGGATTSAGGRCWLRQPGGPAEALFFGKGGVFDDATRVNGRVRASWRFRSFVRVGSSCRRWCRQEDTRSERVRHLVRAAAGAAGGRGGPGRRARRCGRQSR